MFLKSLQFPYANEHGGWKPTETSVTEFYYKNINLSLEELKNIKKILFLIKQEPVQIISRNKS